MATSKPSLAIFTQNKIGGVQFYYSSLVAAGAFGAFDVRYVLYDSSDPETKLTRPLDGAPSSLLPLDERDNLYHAFRNVARAMPTRPGVVMANLELELCCLDVHRRPDLTVAHVCHDDYYVGLALEHAHTIDVFIAHNPYFAERLKAGLPAERAGDVHFLPFGIRQYPEIRRSPNAGSPLRVVYIGRLALLKGIMDLPAIDDRLRALGVKVEWSVLGTGPDQKDLERAVAGRGNFTIQSPADNRAMLNEAAKGDVFVLPSRLDGTPLAVMEAMSVGLVPVIAEFNPGAHWMTPPEVGFVYPTADLDAAAAAIARLDASRPELEIRSEAAAARARQEFDINKKAHIYSDFFDHWREMKRPATAPARHYGTRLDQPWMPNPLVLAVRHAQSWMRSARNKGDAAIES